MFGRNLLLVVWPIEVIISLINPSRKIGDFIAGTKIVQTDIPQDRKTSKPEITICLLIGYLFAAAITIPFYYYTLPK